MTAELLTEFAGELRKRAAGEIRLDPASRRLYSTDASIYQIEPRGVFFPRHEEDLVAAVLLAAKYNVPIVPRGSGTSLAGQTVGPAVVIDCSRYLNKILEINPEEGWARVQPGLVLNAFNYAAAGYDLMYGPDPASSDRATFGGMLGNNSTGAHSISYGMTSDNVLGVDAILADGSQARLESVKMQEAYSRAESDSVEGALYRQAVTIREQQAAVIKDRWPRTWRRASGYSLNYLLPWSASRPPMWTRAGAGEFYPPIEPGSLNLAPAIVGSEGTLLVLKRIQIRLVPKPKQTVLGVLSFPSIAEACDAAPGLLGLEPSAIELIPQAMIRLARNVPAYAKRLGFIHGDPAAILIIEFAGGSQTQLEAKLKLLGPDAVLARSQAEQDEVWAVRKVGLGLLMSRSGDAKPLPFIEDVAVPVEKLGEFVRGFQAILAEWGTGGDFYAHASAGCLHVRPLINLKTLRGTEQMRGITQAVMKLAKRMGGAMSGEHGDGLSHGEWLEETFGPEINAAFSALKHAADPKGILNPNKALAQPQHMDENLRYGPNYKSDPWLPILDFSRQGGLGGAIEMCNGAGVCRKDGGVMCPSFQATREEMHSTRGRANLLRAMISTGITGASAEKAAHSALDLCLECKGCKAECPSGVDVAKLKYEFLNHYYETHRRPLRDYLFGYIGSLGKLGQTVAPISNWMLHSAPGKVVGEKIFGLSAKRSLPAFQRSGNWKSSQPVDADVFFLRDPFVELFYPDVAQAALRVLEAAGCKFAVLPVVGAGRTMISKGLLKQAQKHARQLLWAVETRDPARRMPVVGVEPSEIYTLKDEYLDLLPNEEGAVALAKRAFMLDEFLLRPGKDGVAPVEKLKKSMANSKSKAVLLHGHCYQKAQPPADDGLPSGASATAQLLKTLGFEVDVVNSGCCGMAGSFGYEAEHYDLSMQIGEMVLFPAVRAAGVGQQVVASGVSCRAQIASGTGREALHPVSLIASQLPPQ